MIVIVETNFILELVFQQEQAEACEGILELCGAGSANSLAIPAFCISEALVTLERKQIERRSFAE